jgi:hypothetical protein
MSPVSEENPDSQRKRKHDLPPVLSRRTFRQLTAPDRSEESEDSEPHGGIFISAESQPAAAFEKKRRRWPFHFLPAFWTVTGILSLVVNVILIVVLITLAKQVFLLKAVVQNQLIDGLANNFQLMDQARIKTNINVSTQVPAQFTLPVETDTSVILTKETAIKSARVTVSTGGLQINNATANIVLPAGTELPIHLKIEVPVDQQIPVNLNVPVDIPLNQTDLHKPFVGLQQVVQPYKTLLQQVPSNWTDIVCGPNPSDFCKALLP